MQYSGGCRVWRKLYPAREDFSLRAIAGIPSSPLSLWESNLEMMPDINDGFMRLSLGRASVLVRGGDQLWVLQMSRVLIRHRISEQRIQCAVDARTSN